MAFSNNEGFSIREYTWRMRNVDVVKCWPFDDITTYDERKMKSFLPQITVKKFRWWFYELEFAISGSKKKKFKRKKGLLKRNDSVIEEGVESDDDKVASKKVKTPKRRSIEELIAVAPPPREILNKDEGIRTFESLVSKNANCVEKERRIKRGNPESRMNMKANGLLECKIAKKKRPYKSTMHPTVSSSCWLFDKQAGEDSIVAGLCGKKKPQLKSIVKGKKSNIVRTSKLFSECVKPDSPPQAIGGKLGKVVSDQSSISHILHNASDKHQCGTTGIRQSNKDDVIGELREESRCSQLREVSRVNDASRLKECVQGTREDATGSISEKAQVGLSFDPIDERNLCEMQHFLDKVNIVRDATTSVEESYFSRDQGALLTKERHLYACGGGQKVDIQLPGSSSFAPNACQIYDGLSENKFPSVNDLYLKECASAPLESSWLSLSTLKENFAMHPHQFVRESSSRSFIPRLTPKELMHSICTPLNWKQKEVVHGEIRKTDDFVGLPLNSQGELIKCTQMVAGNFTSLGARVSLNKDLPLQNSYITMSSELDNVESSHQLQSTMRLMGKDFSVGDRNLQYGFGSIGTSISPKHLFEKHGFVIQESAKCEYPYLSSTQDVVGMREKGDRETSALGFPVFHPNPTWSLGTLQTIFPGDTKKRALLDHLPSFPDNFAHNRFRNKWKARGPNKCSPVLLEDPTLQFHNLSPTQLEALTHQDFPTSQVDTHCDNLEDESCSFNDLENAKASDLVDSSIDGGSSELVSGQTRSGPVKLSAGGKHVLKPSKKACQTNNPSPTSSTIRFVETTRAQNELLSGEKPARIYRF